MGLFGKKEPKQQGSTPAFASAISIRAWAVPPRMESYRLPAQHESAVYTYNGEPFNGLRVDDRFIIAAVPADVSRGSPYTGTQMSTGERDNVAYEYNGQVFGFSSSHSEAVRKLMRAGYRVEVEAYISGFDMQLGYVDDSTYNTL